jgi:hypothetical protein
MANKIIFIDAYHDGALDRPQPASQYLPEWYKKMPSYLQGEKGPWTVQPNGSLGTRATIKRCMPVFDAITAGYMLTTFCDIDVVLNEDGEQVFMWTSSNAIEFHPIEQANLHPKVGNTAFPKFMNPWGIKTPKGYSTLFIPPTHRENPMQILEGVVDSDSWFTPVNLPFSLKDSSWTGHIPAGTPIAQVIPFKRENWESELGTKEDTKNHFKLLFQARLHWNDAYKNKWRSAKNYK